MIWKKRNSILFKEETLAVLALKNRLIKVVKGKALTFTNVVDNAMNKRFQHNWGIAPSIFAPTVTNSSF